MAWFGDGKPQAPTTASPRTTAQARVDAAAAAILDGDDSRAAQREYRAACVDRDNLDKQSGR